MIAERPSPRFDHDMSRFHQRALALLRVTALVLALSLLFGGLALYISGAVSTVAQYATVVHAGVGIALFAVLGLVLLLQAVPSPRAVVRPLRKAVLPLLGLAALILVAELTWKRLIGAGITAGPPMTLSLYLWTAIYLVAAVRRSIREGDIRRMFDAGPQVFLLFAFLSIALLNGDGAFKSGTPRMREVHTLAGVFLIAQLVVALAVRPEERFDYRSLLASLRVLVLCAVPAIVLAALPNVVGRLGAIPLDVPRPALTVAARALGPTQVKLASGQTFDRGEYEQLAQTCGTAKCHPTIERDWAHSSHHRAATDPIYQAALDLLVKERGRESAPWCQGCHSPVDLVMSDGEDRKTGVDCLTCHLVASYTTEGNASITLRDLSLHERDYLAQPGSPLWRYLVGALPDLHKKTFDVTHLRDSEFCESCHRVLMPETVSGHTEAMLLAADMKDMAGSPFGSRGYRCQDCHMKRGLDEGAYSMSEHLFIGGGLTEAQSERDPEMLRMISRWLSGDVQARLNGYPSLNPWANPRLDGVKTYLDLDLGGRWQGDTLLLSYRVTNAFIAHSFPKMVDLVRVWMETEVRDADGTVLAHLGTVDAQGRIIGPVPTLGATQVNGKGEPISHHRVWEIRDVVDNRVLMPEQSRSDTIEIPLERQPAGSELTVTARWNYQRTEPDAFYWAVGDGYGPPAHVMLVEKTITVPVATAQ